MRSVDIWILLLLSIVNDYQVYMYLSRLTFRVHDRFNSFKWFGSFTSKFLKKSIAIKAIQISEDKWKVHNEMYSVESGWGASTTDVKVVPFDTQHPSRS